VPLQTAFYSFKASRSQTVFTEEAAEEPMIFHKLLQRIRRKMLPTEQEKMFLKWNADGGDQALRFDYDLTPDSLVLDLGGYEGQWASDIFARYLCHVVVFEPATEFAANIRHRFRCNPKIRVCSFGLGAVSRTETLYLSADGSSTFTKDGPTETIQIVDVAAWANQENIQAVALMKINIEGGEYELLKRLIEIGSGNEPGAPVVRIRLVKVLWSPEK
jgi:FkbM family methyltransferase